MLNRAFKGVWIPKEIYLSEDLSWTEKILLVEINSLDNDQGCFASNEHFAEFLGISISRVAHLMSHLRELNLIIDMKTDGRTRWISVNPVTAAYLPCRKQQGSLVENSNETQAISNTVNNTGDSPTPLIEETDKKLIANEAFASWLDAKAARKEKKKNAPKWSTIRQTPPEKKEWQKKYENNTLEQSLIDDLPTEKMQEIADRNGIILGQVIGYKQKYITWVNANAANPKGWGKVMSATVESWILSDLSSGKLEHTADYIFDKMYPTDTDPGKRQ